MSQTVVALPRFVEFRSQYNQELLRYLKEDGEVKGFVQFSGGEHVGSPEAKFEVHSSETGNGLVHIRSCYNNKYLRLLEQTSNNWIVAGAETPEEDRSKRSCTLFRPTSVDGNPQTIRLTNVYTENYLCLWRATGPAYYACILAAFSDPDAFSCDVINFIEWQSPVLLPEDVVVLPRLIKLRSQPTKQLLRYIKEAEGVYKDIVQFSGENVGSADATFEVHSSETGNGMVHIRSCYNNKYLQLSDSRDWIVATAEKPEEDQSKRSCTLLRPTSVDGDPKTIRLKHVYLQHYLYFWQASLPYYNGSVLVGTAYYHAFEVFDVID